MATISLVHRSIDPHCIFNGYTFYQCNYGSAVYLMVAIPKTFLSLKHRYAYLGFETCHNICLMVVCSFYQVLWVYTLAWTSTKYFSHQFASSNFILWGAICYTSKLLTLIVSQVSSLQRSQVSHFSHKCRKCQGSILPWFLCRAYNDMRRTLETPQTFELKKETHTKLMIS